MVAPGLGLKAWQDRQTGSRTATNTTVLLRQRVILVVSGVALSVWGSAMKWLTSPWPLLGSLVSLPFVTSVNLTWARLGPGDHFNHGVRLTSESRAVA